MRFLCLGVKYPHRKEFVPCGVRYVGDVPCTIRTVTRNYNLLDINPRKQSKSLTVAPLEGRQATLGTAQKLPRETVVPPKTMPLAPHGRYTLQSEPLLAGDDGTAQTIAKIRPLVESGKRDPFVNHTTGQILRGARVAPYDEHGEIRAIFEWVLRNIRFTKDPEGKECLRPARTTLEWGFGDCDDINAILLPAMFGTVGYHVRIVTIASHPAAPEQFSHVYCEVSLRGRWIPVDAARQRTRLGVEPSRHYRKRVWSLAEDSFEDLEGCGAGCAMRRRTLLGTHMRLGRYYGSQGLGQDGFDWSTFSDIVKNIGTSTSQIIGAAKAPAGIVYPSYGAYPSPYGGASPYGTAYPSPYGPPPVTAALTGISGNTLLLLGGLGLVLLLGRR